jgi:hypothetical protein
MYAEERRQEIVAVVRQNGRGDVTHLAEQVTPETIRRDLSDLERRNVLRRVSRWGDPNRTIPHGAPTVPFEPPRACRPLGLVDLSMAVLARLVVAAWPMFRVAAREGRHRDVAFCPDDARAI